MPHTLFAFLRPVKYRKLDCPSLTVTRACLFHQRAAFLLQRQLPPIFFFQYFSSQWTHTRQHVR